MSVRRMNPLDTANVYKIIQLSKKLVQKYKKKKNEEYIRSMVRRLFVERLMRRRVEFSLKEGAFFFSFLNTHW